MLFCTVTEQIYGDYWHSKCVILWIHLTHGIGAFDTPFPHLNYHALLPVGGVANIQQWYKQSNMLALL